MQLAFRLCVPIVIAVVYHALAVDIPRETAEPVHAK